MGRVRLSELKGESFKDRYYFELKEEREGEWKSVDLKYNNEYYVTKNTKGLGLSSEEFKIREISNRKDVIYSKVDFFTAFFIWLRNSFNINEDKFDKLDKLFFRRDSMWETGRYLSINDGDLYIYCTHNGESMPRKIRYLIDCLNDEDKISCGKYAIFYGETTKEEGKSSSEEEGGKPMNINETVELLKSNKQLILNGAPGTGKTYSARKEIAKELLEIKKEEDDDFKLRMKMVQFHPSYDYTDFIEGIRPNLTNSDPLTYTLKNGSFKTFCRQAGVIERIIFNRDKKEKITKTTIRNYLGKDNEDYFEFWARVYNDLEEDIKKYNQNSSVTEDDIKELTDKLPPFLFIIDEINRAEISKVLGEVMFCLDPDYRGEKGRIATQYSNSVTADTFFTNMKNDEFFIPSNVYIIGTMNDIDRSVENFDFALRRRFAWQEIEADDVMMKKVFKDMKVEKELGNDFGTYCTKIKNLNESIVNELKLSRHYRLGPSYFAKIIAYMGENGVEYKEALKKVWNNHISQILNEYVKGKKKDKELGKIKKEFCEYIVEKSSQDTAEEPNGQ